MTWLAAATAATLVMLSLLHVRWAVMGTEGSGAIPEVEGVPVFRPGIASSLLVATALAGAAWLVWERSGGWPAALPDPLARWGTWAVAAAFLGRAIGDFRLVGIFKRVRGTRFARLDDRYFIPLCVAIGTAAAWIAGGAG